MTRLSGRTPDELRRVGFERRHAKHAEGAVLVEFGDTQVLCTASVEDSVPAFLRGKGQGWITAEYGMLPRAASRAVRVWVARGSMPYSAVIQPWALPRRKPGTPSSTLAVHSTWVSPNSTSTTPSACRAWRRVKLTCRSSSLARPEGRCMRRLSSASAAPPPRYCRRRCQRGVRRSCRAP